MPEQFPEIPVGGIAITLKEVEEKVHFKVDQMTDAEVEAKITAVKVEVATAMSATSARASLFNVVTLVLSLATKVV